jgi:hypothetical protein
MSNFAIGMIEPVSAESFASTGGQTAAAGTSSAYVYNDEPGLVFRSSAALTTAHIAQFNIDLGKSVPLGMLALFGLPETFTGAMWVNLSNTAAGNFDVWLGTGNVATLPFSSSYTSPYRRGMLVFPSRFTARYARVHIQPTSTSQVLELSRLALCDCLQPVDNVEWGFKFEVDDTSKVEVSDLGFDEVVPQRILPTMSGTIPWGQIAEEPRMRKLVYRAGGSREVVACLDPSDTVNGEDKLIWGRFRSGASLTLADYDINQLDFSVRAILP